MKKFWTVTIFGSGFLRQNNRMGFELGGIVEAADPSDAVSVAVSLATQRYPELDQAKTGSIPRPVINAEEIEEFEDAPPSEINKVDVIWYVDEPPTRGPVSLEEMRSKGGKGKKVV